MAKYILPLANLANGYAEIIIFIYWHNLEAII